MKFKKTLGLEVHAQINTKTKLFSRALVDDEANANTCVDFLDAGFPGALPVVNEQAIHLALRTALALNMEINDVSIFDRKHYFYQDLPLGYQITQFYKPIGVNGYIECSFGKIRINRLHIECDAGKSIYKEGRTYIDLNRSGVPLMEIVTEPDFHHEDEVIEYMKELRAILLAVKTCKCDMEKGNLRADVNISVSATNELGTRAEIKNLNSFSAIRKAIQYEANFQIETLKSGGVVQQETKLFDSNENVTQAIRDKADAHEYLYFPDPDLLPVKLDKEFIQQVKENLPKLPKEMREDLQSYGIQIEQSYVLTETLERFEFFEQLTNDFNNDLKLKTSNWISSELLGKLAKLDIELEDLLRRNRHFVDNFKEIIKLCETEEVTRVIAKLMIDEIIIHDKNFNELFANSELLKKIDIDLDLLIISILDKSPDEIEKFKKGKVQIVMYFVGLVMKETKGKCSADLAKEKIIEELEKRK